MKYLLLLQIGLAILNVIFSSYMETSVCTFAIPYTIFVINIGIIINNIHDTHYFKKRDGYKELQFKFVILLLVIHWILTVAFYEISQQVFY